MILYHVFIVGSLILLSREEPCGVGSCSTGCCNADKKCTGSEESTDSMCIYCTDNLLVCPDTWLPGASSCSPTLCQFGCCTTSKSCGSRQECEPQVCNPQDCKSKTGFACCNKKNACVLSASECYYCTAAPEVCPGVNANPCVHEDCVYGCCDGDRCGDKEECESQAKYKAWFWWTAVVIFLAVVFIVVICIVIRRSRRRQMMMSASGSFGPYSHIHST